MGSAGAGKSTLKAQKYLKHLKFKDVDPDEIKKTHPDYNPDDPSALHDWSKDISEAKYKSIVTDGTGSPVILDGTGKNWDKLEKRVRLAADNGYKTFLMWVYVPIEVSFFRNRNRERFVPEDIIVEQYAGIRKSYQVLRNVVTNANMQTSFNMEDVRDAEQDIENYPPVRKERPPRPWMPEYAYKSGKVRVWRTKLIQDMITPELMALWAERYGEENLDPEYRKNTRLDEKKLEKMRKIRKVNKKQDRINSL